MRFQFRRKDDQFFHVETGDCAGYVRALKDGRVSVHRALTDMNERDKIGVVNSMDDALATLTNYYGHNWPKWKRIRESQLDRDAGYTLHTAYTAAADTPSSPVARRFAAH